MKDEPGSLPRPGERRSVEGPSLATYAGVGIQFAIAVVLFAFAGVWLDGRLGTSPLFVLLGVFVGGAAAFYSMYRKLMDAQDRSKKE